MKVNDFLLNIRNTTQNITENSINYLSFLKVISSNYKLSCMNQISVYLTNPSATVCARYEFWKKKNRVVIRNQKGIPAIFRENNHEYISYLFDITQTHSNTTENNISIWKYDTNGLSALQQMSKLDSNAENILIKTIVNHKVDSDISIGNIKGNPLYIDFIKDSLQICIANKINLTLDLSTKEFDKVLNQLDEKATIKTLNYISSSSREIIHNMIERSEREKKNGNEERKNNPDPRRLFRANIRRYASSNGIKSTIRRRVIRRILGKYEIKLSTGHIVSREVSKSYTDVSRGDIVRLSVENRNNGKEFQNDSRAKTDEVIWTDGRNENTESREVQSADEQLIFNLDGNDSPNGDNRKLESYSEQNETKIAIENKLGKTLSNGEFESIIQSKNINDLDSNPAYTKKIALRIGVDFILVDEKDVYNISLTDTEINVNVNNFSYPMYLINDYNVWESYLDQMVNGMIESYPVHDSAQYNYSNGWYVEFCECDKHPLAYKDYGGMKLSPKIVSEIRNLDKAVKYYNILHPYKENIPYPEQEYLGYHKYYFDKYVNGVKTEHHRIDIGDGEDVNKEFFDYIENNLDDLREITLDDIKKSVINFLNEEFNEDYEFNDFDKNYPDISHVGISYTTTADGNNNIEYELDLNELTATQYVDDIVINKIDFKAQSKDLNEAMILFKEHIDNHGFDDFVRLNENDVKQVLNAELDYDGNIYYPSKIIAINVGTEFILLDEKKSSYIKTVNTGLQVIVDGIEYDVMRGVTFNESRKVDFLIDHRGVKSYKLNEHLKERIHIDSIHDLSDILLSEINKNQDLNLDNFDAVFQQEYSKKMFEVARHQGNIPRDMKTPSEVSKFRNELKDKYIRNTQNLNNVLKIDTTLEENIIENPSSADNFIITKDILNDRLSPSERLNNNLEAISMLNRVEKGERELDSMAQEVLAKYVGWGGLSEVFDEEKGGQWEKAREFLKTHLSTKEYDSAKESTLTAFYTPKFIIDSIYQCLKDMGFKKGNILEPSIGIGNFIGNLPEEMQGSKFYGVELDSLSGRIAKLLYPQSDIKICGFEETTFSNNFFDIAIGNVPFGDFKVNDRTYDKYKFLIHDYFFAKTIDKVRNGGVIAFITSSGTLDKKDDRVRRYISSRAEFLGAIRLPNNTFKGVAGTEVTSDIIFLKKRDSVLDRPEDWTKLDTDENGLTYNKYFVDNPDMVLGHMKEITGRFGNTLACISGDSDELEILLKKASRTIALSTKYEEVELIDNEVVVMPATDDVKNFSYTLIDDDIYYRENSILIKKEMAEKSKERIKLYINVKKSLKELITLQKDDATDEKITFAQNKLDDAYSQFYIRHGHINKPVNERLLREDSDFPLVSSIEVMKGSDYIGKADIFTKRTIKKAIAVEKVDNGTEALILSLSQKGYLDFEYMEKLTGKDRQDLIKELSNEIYVNIDRILTNDKKDKVYRGDEFPLLPISDAIDNPSMFNFITEDEYLSGNLKHKMDIVEDFIDFLETYLNRSSELEMEEIEKVKEEIKLLNKQHEILKNSLPEKIFASDINARLGTTWIPTEYIEEFVYELLDTPYYTRRYVKVTYSAQTGNWYISNKNNDSFNDFANMTYGTSDVSAYKLIEDSLNLKDSKVYDRIIDDDGNKISVLNKKKTAMAMQKQELIKEKFRTWIFNDADRRAVLEKIYNDRFNSTKNRHYNGDYLSFDGMNSEIKLKKHQVDAIARCLYGGNTLLAHVVGAGKTFEMVATAMESKRLGMCSKSLFVVPNHLTGQIGREFMQLYPSANIMVADKKDFEPKNRKRFIGKIATGEYDAVIIGHSQFEKIPMSKEYQQKHIEEQINEITRYIEEYKLNRDQRFTVKELMKTEKKLSAKLEKLNDDFKKDDFITFEELGVDRLFVDEAHNYKNLYLHTKMQNVAGLSQSEAQKSSDMFMKCRYMDEKTGGKGVIFATGTPVSNSLTELYTMQRYLQYDELKRRKLEHFDAWASTYAEVTSALELSPDGKNYRMKKRLSKYFGIPELMSMFKEIADIKTADMIDVATPNSHFEVIKTKATKEQEEIVQSFAERSEKIRNRLVEPSEDNMLKVTFDGKCLALDQRLINPLLNDNDDSKVNKCVEKVLEIYNRTEKDKSTQIIFSDMSTPNKKEFNIYDDIKTKLIGLGVKENEIAFIHDANSDKQKEEMFEKVRNGEIRILMGSTQKMGAGTNIQDKLIALHDLDVPWRPSDLEQRAGRIIRRGNTNEDVYIYRYITENTFDGYLWQMIENKQKFISQIMTSKSPVRTVEDIDEIVLSYAELKAIATGNPLIKEKMTLDTEVSKLKLLESDYLSNKYRFEDKVLKTYPAEIVRYTKIIENIKKDMDTVEKPASDDEKFTSITINGKKITDKKIAGETFLNTVKSLDITSSHIIGQYRNLDIEITYSTLGNQFLYNLKGAHSYSNEIGNDSIGMITRLDNSIEKMSTVLKNYEDALAQTEQKLKNAKIELEKPFEHETILKEKLLRLKEVNMLLQGDMVEECDFSPLADAISFIDSEYEVDLTENNKKITLYETHTKDYEHTIYLKLDLNTFTLEKSMDDDSNIFDSKQFDINSDNQNETINMIAEYIKGISVESLSEINFDMRFKTYEEPEEKETIEKEVDFEMEY